MKLNQLSSPVLFSGIAGEMRQGNIARIMGSPNRQRDNVIKGCRIRLSKWLFADVAFFLPVPQFPRVIHGKRSSRCSLTRPPSCFTKSSAQFVFCSFLIPSDDSASDGDPMLCSRVSQNISTISGHTFGCLPIYFHFYMATFITAVMSSTSFCYMSMFARNASKIPFETRSLCLVAGDDWTVIEHSDIRHRTLQFPVASFYYRNRLLATNHYEGGGRHSLTSKGRQAKPRGETPLFDRPYDETADAIPEAAE